MDVFISYRRDGSGQLPQLIQKELEEKSISCFYDRKSMKTGKFPFQIYDKIDQSLNYIVIFSPRSLDRCTDEPNDESYCEDWFRNEIRYALKKKDANPNFRIIPIILDGFRFPPKEQLPSDIADIADMHGEIYSDTYHDGFIQNLTADLVDENGRSLLIAKKSDHSNVFYENGGMTDAERQRIILDRKCVKEIEDDIFGKMLRGRENVVVFNPAVYEITSVIEKYRQFPEISRVIGFVNSKDDADAANEKYDGYAHFIKANIEDENFEDIMDGLLENEGADGFDLVELTLILRDSKNPESKLIQVAEHLNRNGIIYIRELDDDLAIAYPDENDYLSKMKQILCSYPWSGNRTIGKKIFTYLESTRPREIFPDNRRVASPADSSRESTRKRKELFDVYFSYVEPELKYCLKRRKDDILDGYLKWVQENYNAMRDSFTKPYSFFSSGFMFFYAIYD